MDRITLLRRQFPRAARKTVIKCAFKVFFSTKHNLARRLDRRSASSYFGRFAAGGGLRLVRLPAYAFVSFEGLLNPRSRGPSSLSLSFADTERSTSSSARISARIPGLSCVTARSASRSRRRISIILSSIFDSADYPGRNNPSSQSDNNAKVAPRGMCKLVAARCGCQRNSNYRRASELTLGKVQ